MLEHGHIRTTHCYHVHIIPAGDRGLLSSDLLPVPLDGVGFLTPPAELTTFT